MNLLDPARAATNELIERLPASDRKRLLAACEHVDVVIGEEIYRERGRIPYVYFPLDSMFSELTPSSDPPVEAFLTGREGMVGFVLALGAAKAPMHCSIQGSGRALRMAAGEFTAEVGRGGRLRALVHASVYFQLQQTARNVYCMRHHELSPRLARWLLMAMDRHRSRRFVVTHKFLAAMLGTRRAGVTVAARTLQLEGLIRYRRGEVEILDRARLEAASCSCYAYAIEAHRQAFRR